MHIVTHWDRTDDPLWWDRPGLGDLVNGQEDPAAIDTATLSDEAVRLFRESALKPLMDDALSLKSIARRIAVVQAEIAEVWNSALPDEEKYRQISTKENEIALLRAGQFTFAKNGFYRAA